MSGWTIPASTYMLLVLVDYRQPDDWQVSFSVALSFYVGWALPYRACDLCSWVA